jgi:catechol 2,3-dioxygenase-like lactoylglutathione lyase family enzyme
VISHIDHLVLTVKSVDATCSFYERALGFKCTSDPGRPVAMHFGQCKINVHPAEHPIAPLALAPKPGSADFCLITEDSIGEVVRHLVEMDIEVEVGPIDRTGAQGPMTSAYFRDPDGNLLEVSQYSKK